MHASAPQGRGRITRRTETETIPVAWATGILSSFWVRSVDADDVSRRDRPEMSDRSAFHPRQFNDARLRAEPNCGGPFAGAHPSVIARFEDAELGRIDEVTHARVDDVFIRDETSDLEIRGADSDDAGVVGFEAGPQMEPAFAKVHLRAEVHAVTPGGITFVRGADSSVIDGPKAVDDGAVTILFRGDVVEQRVDAAQVREPFVGRCTVRSHARLVAAADRRTGHQTVGEVLVELPSGFGPAVETFDRTRAGSEPRRVDGLFFYDGPR